MAGIRHFHSREASLWQSATDEVISKSSSSGHAQDVGGKVVIQPADPKQQEMAASHAVAEALENEQPLPGGTSSADVATEGIASTAQFCASAAFKLAQARVKKALTGDDSDVKKFQEQLGSSFGTCDPKWVECIDQFVKLKIDAQEVPYRRHTALTDFVIEGNNVLPDKACIALVGDWGTGDTNARLLLRQIVDKKPDVVFHLGDVYYSGTEHEFQNYFYAIWQNMLGLTAVPWGGKAAGPTNPATFTLSGNHDMYAGGAPYYTTLDMLGQPASYFCLRNPKWQFIAMDTGLHDRNPLALSMTTLEDSEVEWVRDKILNAGGRQTVLLSHHQLFTTFESIGADKNRINQNLLGQLGDLLDKVTVWFWGHEHDFVVYPKFENVLGRCIGHASVPVASGQIGDADATVPFNAACRLALDANGGLFQHGYAIMQLDGLQAKVTYYQFDTESQDEVVLFEENFGQAMAAG
jgi:3',5'-cyclic AMP phosphodiesterase CpdA